MSDEVRPTRKASDERVKQLLEEIELVDETFGLYGRYRNLADIEDMENRALRNHWAQYMKEGGF